jgi:hypothetical protein
MYRVFVTTYPLYANTTGRIAQKYHCKERQSFKDWQSFWDWGILSLRNSPYATNENAGGVEKWRILKTLAAALNKSKKKEKVFLFF